MTTKRRTKRRYAELFDHPRAMFPPGPDGPGVKVILWPNGQPEIWFTDADGKGQGFRVTAGSGPAGLSLHISKFTGAPAMTLAGLTMGKTPQSVNADLWDISLCQYNEDEWSQVFKAWYQAPGKVKHPGPKPSEGS